MQKTFYSNDRIAELSIWEENNKWFGSVYGIYAPVYFAEEDIKLAAKTESDAVQEIGEMYVSFALVSKMLS